MLRTLQFTLIVLCLFSARTNAQTTETLKKKISQILLSKNAVVGVTISGPNTTDTLSINGDKKFPMQSTFKFPIALTMLSEVDKGHFKLDSKVEIKKSEMLPDLWSPIREKYPDGVTLTIGEILRFIITMSDNVGCDVTLKLLGGPKAVEAYINKLGFSDFAVKINEETMQNNWDMQFLNWTTPKEANRILDTFYANKKELLSESSYKFIWTLMQESETGKSRLQGQLPKGTLIAHKTGFSGAHKSTGIYAAVNDIGIIFLPNGKYFCISVFITDSKENLESNEKIIADIASAAWLYFSRH